ncbi:MAG: HAMP domain-containing protein [Magnetococcales bacterium]|nr:HAMP domain-containing protein [Magnetococcales bacterium]
MRFFLKLFLSFWLVVSVLGGMFFWGGHHLRDHLDPLLEANMERMMSKRRQVATLLETQGLAATRSLLENDRETDDIIVFERADQDILGRPLPGHLSRPRPEPGHDNRPPPFSMGRPGPGPHHEPPPHIPLETRDPEGHAYRVALGPMRSPWSMAWREYPFFPVVVLVISGMVVFPLARHFTRPLRYLQGATLRLAEGDLTTRAPGMRRLFSDELDDLGQDFNFMAQRLEVLFHGQKRLLRDVSHELRSPLARMRVALGLAEQESSGVRGEHWQRLNLELDRLDTLIGQIIRLSRPEAPDQVPKESLVDLGALVEAVVADARFESGGEESPLTILGLDPAMLWADGGAIHSAVENVVRNAMRHSPPGVGITLQLIRRGTTAHILVKDAGPGVPEADLPRLTEPFFRVGEARDRLSGGHGLGLAIATSAVRDHKGELSVRNRPEGGLEVEITLPVEPMPAWENETGNLA